MKITLKITNLEITIEDEAIASAAGAAPAAMMTATVQSLEQAVAPLITPHVKGKVVTPRKPRAAAPAPDTKSTEPPASDSTETPPVTLNGYAVISSTEAPTKTDEPTTETPKKRLPFEEFDKLVRSEMERLAPVPGTMPGHSLWNEMRDSQLPTMGGVISRYDCTDLKGLAALLNLAPPISKPGPVSKQ